MTALLARHLPPNYATIETGNLIWFAFTLSVAASIGPLITGGVTDSLSNIVAIVGSGGCGWLWLLSRSLFHEGKPIQRWNIYVVLAIIAIEGTAHITHSHPRTGPMADVYHILGNTEGFVCVGALVMVFAEVFSSFDNRLSDGERRFRLTFALAFATMIALSLLWVLNANEDSLGGQWRDPVLIATALTAVVGTRLCLSYRKRHPLALARRSRHACKASGNTSLAKRIIQVLHTERKFATPELKIADLAEMLGEQEYKVTQCITGALGYRNFNHMINAHRIVSAKEELAKPENKGRPILSVAFDCGFNSIGPFNRAFKREVGMTPREYRASVE